MNTRLNIKKIDGNIVQKHGGLKQVGFKQLGPGVEIGVHGVHDEKRVWFEVELQGTQGDHEAEVFQVSNDDTVVAQRRLEDKQPEEKTNTDCLVKEQKKEYQTGWKIKTGNVLNFCNQRSTQQCTKSGVAKHLGVAGLQQRNGLVKETNVTLLAKLRSSEYSWDTVKNMSFNESGKYKKTFIGSGVGTGSMQVLQGDEFEGATLSMGTIQYREDSNEATFAVAAVEKIYAHESLTFNNTVACEVISMWKAGLKDDMDARSDVYVLSNGCKKCSDDSDGYYWESTPVSLASSLKFKSISLMRSRLLGSFKSSLRAERTRHSISLGRLNLGPTDDVNLLSLAPGVIPGPSSDMRALPGEVISKIEGLIERRYGVWHRSDVCVCVAQQRLQELCSEWCRRSAINGMSTTRLMFIIYFLL
ncbi:zinc finger, CCHC-type containing protein [Tanacetum coccineum]|uniref:Zinc finger, CCHC-type containing protein n=1 Tax=Tanacetum coccineum TaxID=301880 RepID=A0ABQ4YSM9_9ASTR